jgi:hypothetical protein
MTALQNQQTGVPVSVRVSGGQPFGLEEFRLGVMSKQRYLT